MRYGKLIPAMLINTQNFKVLYDADCLVNLKDEYETKDKEKLKTIIEKVFLTQAGKAFAKKTISDALP